MRLFALHRLFRTIQKSCAIVIAVGPLRSAPLCMERADSASLPLSGVENGVHDDKRSAIWFIELPLEGFARSCCTFKVENRLSLCAIGLFIARRRTMILEGPCPFNRGLTVWMRRDEKRLLRGTHNGDSWRRDCSRLVTRNEEENDQN
jgi:hypothetical protein